MKHCYSMLIASALLVSAALVSCESEESFGSQDEVVVPGSGNPETDPDDSYSSSSTNKSSSSTNLVSCDLGDGDCYRNVTASACATYGGDVVTVCPVVGSSSSTSSTEIGCLIEVSGQSQCTLMSEADCEDVADYYSSYPSVTVSVQDNCD